MSSRNSAAFLTMLPRPWLLLGIFVISFQIVFAGATQARDRRISGTLVDDKGQVLTGIAVIASGGSGR
jgi:hypothetical protein